VMEKTGISFVSWDVETFEISVPYWVRDKISCKFEHFKFLAHSGSFWL